MERNHETGYYATFDYMRDWPEKTLEFFYKFPLYVYMDDLILFLSRYPLLAFCRLFEPAFWGAGHTRLLICWIFVVH